MPYHSGKKATGKKMPKGYKAKSTMRRTAKPAKKGYGRKG